MMYLYTDSLEQELQAILDSIEGLSAAVTLKPLADRDVTENHLLFKNGQVHVPLPWDHTSPPIMFEPIDFVPEDLIAIILTQLGYEQEALTYCRNKELAESIQCGLQLLSPDHSFQIEVSDQGYVSLHNHAVLGHFTSHLYNGLPPETRYELALEQVSSEECSAFTIRQYAVLLLDRGHYAKAEQLIRTALEQSLPENATNYLTLDLINVLLASAISDREEIKLLIDRALQYFLKQQTIWVIADLHARASEVAHQEKQYSESLGHITKAIQYYEELGIAEFLAAAFIRKGTLLYTWAQEGQTQFYQAAIDTYQEALKTFTREEVPQVYAEIHHNLAVIYAEMPMDEKKKAMWAAFSATSFKESLELYRKDAYPYEYAMVANNYANALLRYPAAKLGDNTEKAIHYYLEAMEIRTAEAFPVERAHTLLNYLEACWRIHNINKTMERARYRDMLDKAKEVISLTNDQTLIDQAQAHMDQLLELGVAILKD